MEDSNELEKKFCSYLVKVLKGYSINKKKKVYIYLNNKEDLSEANDINICKNMFIEKEKEILERIDNNSKYPERLFCNQKYYYAMKKVPNLQKQALYLLVVKRLSIEKVSEILNVNKNYVKRLRKLAINNFKRNLEKLK